MNYKIVTFGCQMNVHESEKLCAILQERGFEQTEIEANADIIVFNTCCIRQGAEERALGNIGALKKLKAAKPHLIIAVVGCMTQQDGVAKSLVRRFPFVDIVLGTHNVLNLGEHIDSKLCGAKGSIIDVQKEAIGEKATPIRRNRKMQAYVNIMFGCNNFCSYCIVPYVRGRERSRSAQDIIAECSALIENGCKEITLLGQNVNSYGKELEPRLSFAELLTELSKIKGDFWIKFMTSHPKDLTRDVAEAMAASEKIANYIHLPMQSGSDNILSAMNRRYTQQAYLEKIDYIRALMPDCGLSTDFMVGFPNETEEDFLQTLKVIEQVQYDNLFAFIYSRRKGTPADKMDGQIPIAIKRERIGRLLALQKDIAQKKAAALVGETLRVLAISEDNGKISAVSANARAIEVEGDKELVGSFFDCKITKNKHSRLFGKKV